MEMETFYTAVKALDIPGIKIIAADGVSRFNPGELIPPDMHLLSIVALAEKINRRLVSETFISEELLEDGDILAPMVDMIRRAIEDEVALKSF